MKNRGKVTDMMIKEMRDWFKKGLSHGIGDFVRG